MALSKLKKELSIFCKVNEDLKTRNYSGMIV